MLNANRLFVAKKPSLPVGSSKSKQKPRENPFTISAKGEFLVAHIAISDGGSDSTAAFAMPKMSGFFPPALTKRIAECLRILR